MLRLNDKAYPFKPKSGLFADVNSTANKNSAYDGEIVYTTDTGQLFVYNGTEFEAITKFTQFVYNSSGTQTGNRFNSWSDLMTALTSVSGEKRIYFEQNETLPAGAYNLAQTFLYGDGVNKGIVVTIPTGFTLTDWNYGGIRAGLHVISTSANYVYEFDTSQTISINQGFLSCTTESFFYSEGDFAFSQFFAISLDEGTIIEGVATGGYEPIEINGSALVLAMMGSAVIAEDDCVRGAGFYGLQILSSAVSTNYPTHANLSISFDFSNRGSQAFNVGYDNTTSGMTADNTQDAIDELEARVAALEP